MWPFEQEKHEKKYVVCIKLLDGSYFNVSTPLTIDEVTTKHKEIEQDIVHQTSKWFSRTLTLIRMDNIVACYVKRWYYAE